MDSTAVDSPPEGDLLVLQQISRIVSRGDAAESRIQDILRHLAGAPGLMRGRVLLADPDAGTIYIRYAHGMTPAELERGHYRIGEGMSGRVFQTGEAALVANIHDEPDYLARATARDALPEQIAFLAVPIVCAHLPIGVLAAHRLPNSARSARADLALLEVIATLIGQILVTDEQSEPRLATAQAVLRSAPVAAGRDAGEGEHDGVHRDLLLRTAEQLYGQGRLHLAADRFLRITALRPASDETRAAQNRLLEIAGYYEKRGANRLALDVLERLRRARGVQSASDGDSVWESLSDQQQTQDDDAEPWDTYDSALRNSDVSRYRPGADDR